MHILAPRPMHEQMQPLKRTDLVDCRRLCQECNDRQQFSAETFHQLVKRLGDCVVEREDSSPVAQDHEEERLQSQLGWSSPQEWQSQTSSTVLHIARTSSQKATVAAFCLQKEEGRQVRYDEQAFQSKCELWGLANLHGHSLKLLVFSSTWKTLMNMNQVPPTITTRPAAATIINL